MPIDYATPVGQVRLGIPDTDETDPIFTDSQIGGFLTMGGDEVLLAIALACETIAFDNMLLFKANVRSDDGSVTASETSKLMLARAKSARDDFEKQNSGFVIAGGETYLNPWDIYGYRY